MRSGFSLIWDDVTTTRETNDWQSSGIWLYDVDLNSLPCSVVLTRRERSHKMVVKWKTGWNLEIIFLSIFLASKVEGWGKSWLSAILKREVFSLLAPYWINESFKTTLIVFFSLINLKKLHTYVVSRLDHEKLECVNMTSRLSQRQFPKPVYNEHLRLCFTKAVLKR